MEKEAYCICRRGSAKMGQGCINTVREAQREVSLCGLLFRSTVRMLRAG